MPAALISIGDVSVVEGNSGTLNAAVPVTISQPHGNNVTVNYSTANGTATAGSDYNAVSGTLTFTKNETTKSILVPIRGDRIVEPFGLTEKCQREVQLLDAREGDAFRRAKKWRQPLLDAFRKLQCKEEPHALSMQPHAVEKQAVVGVAADRARP